MSGQDYLSNLLDGAQVEWKSLTEVAEYVRGLVYSKSDEIADNHGHKVLRANNISLTRNALNFDDVKYVNQATKVKREQKLRQGDILISAASGSREHVGKVAYVERDIDYYFGGFMGVIRCSTSLAPRYLFHVMTSDLFKRYLDETLNSSTINNLSSSVMGRFKVPIPCSKNPQESLAIQTEIARILDTFSELTAKLTADLTAELTSRKKQYNHYRDQLLRFDNRDVVWKSLGEVAEIGTGTHDTQDAVENGEFVFYARGREPLRLNVFDFDETAIITAGDGAGVGKVFHYAKGKYALHQRAYRIVPNEVMEPRFVYHCMASHFYAYITKASVSSSVTSLRRPMFLNFPIPAPSLAEQARIVAILDKFDALTTSLSEGLPREIELRQKQYAYYRDLLLSFPKPEEKAG